MKHAKVFSAVLLTLAVTGCAGMQQRTMWNHPTGDRAQFEKDLAQCEYETSAATQNTDLSYRSSFGQELDRVMRKKDLGEKCMKAKGYYQVQQ